MKMDAAKMKGIRDDAMALQDYLTDLNNWEKDIKKEDRRLSALHTDTDDQDASIKQPSVMSDSKKSSNIHSGCDPNNTKTSSKKFSQDVPSTEIETEKTSKLQDKEREEKTKATKLKDQGNGLYGSGQFSAAVERYTAGLALDDSNHILHANRAMAYIKLGRGAAAEQDCDACLRLAPDYIKGYLRRGTARLMEGRLTQALVDYRTVLEKEPSNIDAKKQVKEVEKLMTAEKSSKKSNASSPSKSKPIKTLENNTKKRDSIEKLSNIPQSKLQEKCNKSGNGTLSSGSEGSKVQTQQQTDPDVILPANKPLHLRSRKPLQRVRVVDVETEADLPVMTSATTSTEHKYDLQQQQTTATVTASTNGSSAVTTTTTYATTTASVTSTSIYPAVAATDLTCEAAAATEVITDNTTAATSTSSSSSNSSKSHTNKSPSSSSPCEESSPPSAAGAAAPTAHSSTSTPSMPPAPRTSHQFMTSWARIANFPDLALKWLQACKVCRLRQFEIEVDCLMSLVQVMHSWLFVASIEPHSASPNAISTAGSPSGATSNTGPTSDATSTACSTSDSTSTSGLASDSTSTTSGPTSGATSTSGPTSGATSTSDPASGATSTAVAAPALNTLPPASAQLFEFVSATLVALAQSHTFDLNVLFFPRQDNARLKELLQCLRRHQGALAEDLRLLLTRL